MNEIIIAVVSLGSIGLVFGVILSVLDKKLKVEQDPLIEEVLNLLPGINCGACGFAGCKAYAGAAVENKDLYGGCLPGGKDINEKIAAALGLKSDFKSTALKVVVLCGAKSDEKKSSFDYIGPRTCSFANISLANIDCRFGCLGLGDCLEVCPTKALSIEAGLVKVDYSKCIGCGKCVEACPRNILKVVEAVNKDLYVVSCSNTDRGPFTKKVCSKGCIGCGICVKVIKDSCFYLEQGLSKIDYKKIGDKTGQELESALEKCPVKIINKFDA
ncbi:MAG: RnfABCDGE type electron transport complex subunit B [Candidatus Omnitrophica bacterium]|nr:RnfABCDGE type electron transport complex subunit B [Candidatus Omnitrophota bacterium]